MLKTPGMQPETWQQVILQNWQILLTIVKNALCISRHTSSTLLHCRFQFQLWLLMQLTLKNKSVTSWVFQIAAKSRCNKLMHFVCLHLLMGCHIHVGAICKVGLAVLCAVLHADVHSLIMLCVT